MHPGRPQTQRRAQWSQRDQEGRRQTRFLEGPGFPGVMSGSLPRTTRVQAPSLVSLVSAGPEERQAERRGLAGEVEITHACSAEAPPFAHWLTCFYTTFRSLAPTPPQMPPVELPLSTSELVWGVPSFGLCLLRPWGLEAECPAQGRAVPQPLGRWPVGPSSGEHTGHPPRWPLMRA